MNENYMTERGIGFSFSLSLLRLFAGCRTFALSVHDFRLFLLQSRYIASFSLENIVSDDVMMTINVC